MLKGKKRLIQLIRTSLLVILVAHSPAAQTDDPLAEAFRDPPRSAAPRTWFHAMSANMSKAGLTKDLEAIDRVGIGGVLLFNVTQGIPIGKVTYASDTHFEMLRHAAAECKRLGLSFGVHNCDGWSSSGGPWISPEESMKMLVWRDTVISGGRHRLEMPQPTTREGFYRDIKLMAYPALEGEVSDQKIRPRITTSSTNYPKHILTDQRIDRTEKLGANEEGDIFIDYTYDEPKTISSLMLIFTDRHGEAELLSSQDGEEYTPVTSLTKVRTGKGEWGYAETFDGVTARHFRLRFNREMNMREARLSSLPAVDDILGQTLMARREDRLLTLPKTVSANRVIAAESIRFLSPERDRKGRLRIDLPPGEWTLLRLGYTSTGAFNTPASEEGRGLECDKLSRPAFKRHYDAFVGKLLDRTGDLGPDAVQYVEIDSYEMGGQNWTEGMAESFSTVFGYPLEKFLPVLAGRYVESAESTADFLWDFRRHVSDLMTNNYFAYFTELAAADGLKTYVEPYGFGPLNNLDVGGFADIPMGEFWMNRPINQIFSAVSSAHIYGKPVISAESFTSQPEINWAGHPAIAKPSGDLVWTEGVNEFMFHRFVHQANVHVEPGMTMNRYGFHFDRTQTWWENAGADWFEYIARGSYLLRRGYPVADMLVFIGDGAPNSTYSRAKFSPAVPASIKYDCVNTDVLQNRLRSREGSLLLPEGTTYGMLILKNTQTLRISTLRRLVELAEAGVPMAGELPVNLAGYGHSEEMHLEFADLSERLSQRLRPAEAWYNVYQERFPQADCIGADGESLPFFHRRTDEEDIYFLFNQDSVDREFTVDFRVEHKIPELWNPMTGEITRTAVFRSRGEGTRVLLSLAPLESVFVVFREDQQEDGPHVPPEFVSRTELPLSYRLNEEGDINILASEAGQFRVPLATETINLIVDDVPSDIPLEADWSIRFREEDGYEASQSTTRLFDWSTHSEEDIRYYAGTAIYTKRFSVSGDTKLEEMIATLDLGKVAIAAEVWLNGNRVGVSWQLPYQLDISNQLREGENELRIEVTNQWTNRLIGDERYPRHFDGYRRSTHVPNTRMPDWYVNNEPPPPGPRRTFSTADFYSATDPLLPSGLLGPVRITFQRAITLQNH